MQAVELRKKTITELNKMRKDLLVDMKKVGLDVMNDKEKNVKKVGTLKKDCARICTVINEKSLLKEITENE